MLFHDALAEVQPDAQAVRAARGRVVHTEEGLEHIGLMFRHDADTQVMHTKL